MCVEAGICAMRKVGAVTQTLSHPRYYLIGAGMACSTGHCELSIYVIFDTLKVHAIRQCQAVNVGK